MKLQCILAMNEEQIIGVDCALPWNINEDLRRFRTITRNSIVVMGRKTLESLPNGAPLKDRINIILTRSPHKYANNASSTDTSTIYTDFEHVFEVLEALNTSNNKNVFIIGGEEVYSLFLPHIHTIHLTMVHITLPAVPDVAAAGISKFPLSFAQIQDTYVCAHCSAVQEAIDQCATYQFWTFVRK